MKTCNPMVEMWKKALTDLAASQGITVDQAAALVAKEFIYEERKIGEQRKIGLSTDLFDTMNYDPVKDPSHPMHGWNPRSAV